MFKSKLKYRFKLATILALTAILFFSCKEREITEPDYEVQDLGRPSVILTVPLNNSINIPISTEINVWFDELMNTPSIENNFELYRVVRLSPVSTISIDPQNSSTLLAGIDDGGFFKSEDGGNSWLWLSEDSPRLKVIDMQISPVNSSIVFAATGNGVLKSVDGGLSWNLVHQDIFTALFLDWNDENILYIASASSGVLKSEDGGNSWSEKNNGLRLGRPLTDFEGSKYDRDYLVVSSEGDFIYVSQDGGENWERVRNGLEFRDFTTVAIANTSESSTYIASLSGGVFKSVDKGLTWTNTTSNLPEEAVVFDIEIDQTNENYILLSSNQGVSQSTNGGETWSEPKQFSYSHNDEDLVATPHIIKLAANSSAIVIGTTGGVFVSSDGGKNYSHRSEVSKENLLVSGQFNFETWKGEQTIIAYSDSVTADTSTISPYVVERGLTRWINNGRVGEPPIPADPSATKFTFTPDNPLVPGWLYEYKIHGTFLEDGETPKDTRGVEDLENNSLETDRIVKFRTDNQ